MMKYCHVSPTGTSFTGNSVSFYIPCQKYDVLIRQLALHINIPALPADCLWQIDLPVLFNVRLEYNGAVINSLNRTSFIFHHLKNKTNPYLTADEVDVYSRRGGSLTILLPLVLNTDGKEMPFSHYHEPPSNHRVTVEIPSVHELIVRHTPDIQKIHFLTELIAEYTNLDQEDCYCEHENTHDPYYVKCYGQPCTQYQTKIAHLAADEKNITQHLVMHRAPWMLVGTNNGRKITKLTARLDYPVEDNILFQGGQGVADLRLKTRCSPIYYVPLPDIPTLDFTVECELEDARDRCETILQIVYPYQTDLTNIHSAITVCGTELNKLNAWYWDHKSVFGCTRGQWLLLTKNGQGADKKYSWERCATQEQAEYLQKKSANIALVKCFDDS